MWRFHSQNPSLLLSKTQNLTLCSDKRRKKRGGILSQNLFFDCIISHLISKCYFLSLYLSPGFFHLMICRTRIVYSVSDWTLLEKKKTHTPVSTDLMQERECEILFWNPPAQGLLKFTRTTLTLPHTPWTGYIRTSSLKHTLRRTHTHMMTYM